MKQFDEELEIVHEWRAVFYNAEDVAENGEWADYDTTGWQALGNLTLEQQAKSAEKYALEKGYDTFEIEIKKKEYQTFRFNTEATE